MIDLIQPITVQQAYDGITHARRWASWNWWWRMVDDDDGDGFPSPEPRTDSRSALPRGFRAWRRLRIVKRNDFFLSGFFLPETQYIELEFEPERRQGAHEVGGAPPPSWTGGGPPGLHLLQVFFIFSEKSIHEVSGHSMVILLKIASGRVSSIQIMQVRVQNKGKSVWKSRYDRDVSTPPSLNICLSLSNSVDKLKVIKKNFYKLCLLLLF